jgi:hypothetical protein
VDFLKSILSNQALFGTSVQFELKKPFRIISEMKKNDQDSKWCPETESNRRHTPFQGVALPTELSGRTTELFCENAFRSIRPARKRKFLFPAGSGNSYKKPHGAQQNLSISRPELFNKT